MRTRHLPSLMLTSALMVAAAAPALALTQDQVNALGAQYWADGDTRAQCDAQLTANGATQAQENQFHLAFDSTHNWPDGGSGNSISINMLNTFEWRPEGSEPHRSPFYGFD